MRSIYYSPGPVNIYTYTEQITPHQPALSDHILKINYSKSSNRDSARQSDHPGVGTKLFVIEENVINVINETKAIEV